MAIEIRLCELVTRWNSIASELAVECFEETESIHALKAAEYYSLHIKLREHIALEQQVISQSRALMPTWKRHSEIEENAECLHELQRLLDNHTLRHRLASAWASKDQLQRILSDYSGKIIDALKEFIASTLGNPSVPDAEMQAKWSSLMDELKHIHGLKSAFVDIQDICDRIEKSGAENWAGKLRTQPANTIVDSLLPDNWQAAWHLRRLTTYLEKADAREELKKLARERNTAETLLAKAYRDIFAKRTWLKLAENATLEGIGNPSPTTWVL